LHHLFNYSLMTGSNGEDTSEWREDEQDSSGVPSKTSTFRKQQNKSNTLWKINYEQQLLDILKEKSEHTDEDTTFLSLVPAFKTPERWPEVLGRDRNARHYEESQKVWCFSDSMRIVLPQQLLYHRHMGITSKPKKHQQCQIFQTTELQIPQLCWMYYTINHLNFCIFDRQNCNE
jgi:hypothetical protein